MMISKKAIKELVKANNRQISKTALEAIDIRVNAIMRNAIGLTPSGHRITDVEVYHAKG